MFSFINTYVIDLCDAYLLLLHQLITNGERASAAKAIRHSLQMTDGFVYYLFNVIILQHISQSVAHSIKRGER